MYKDKTDILRLIKVLMQTPGYLSLTDLGILKNFYTVYMECIEVEIIGIYGELNNLNMMGNYNIIKNKLETIEWYINHQTQRLSHMLKTYFEEPNLLNDFDPIIQNKEFNSVFEILTNNPENNKQYRNFSIIQRLSEVGDEVVELFREVAKNYG